MVFHRDPPPNLRIWAGATNETSHVDIMTEWLAWPYAIEMAALKVAA